MFSRIVALFLVALPCFGAYSWRGQVDLGTATSGTLSNITLVTVTIADSHLKTVANGGTINDATCTHTISNVPCDFIVTDDAGCGVGSTAFRWGFETYDGSAGTARVFILAPSVTSPTHVIPYVCTGDPSIHTYQGGSPGAEFDTSTAAMWNFPDGTTLDLHDFSANSNTCTGSNSPAAGSGQIDGAVSLPSLAFLQCGTSTTLNPSSVTMEAWVNGSAYTNTYSGVYERSNNTNGSMGLFVKAGGKIAVYVIGSALVFNDGAGTAVLSTGTWYHIAATYDSVNGLITYVNGVQDNTKPANGALGSLSGVTASIGQDLLVGAARRFLGSIDAVHVSSGARSAAYIATEYANQSSPPAITGWTAMGSGGGSRLLLGVGN